jgi:hypothetical protein
MEEGVIGHLDQLPQSLCCKLLRLGGIFLGEADGGILDLPQEDILGIRLNDILESLPCE